MNPEQDPTDKNDIDPSIDPTKLIVQEGDDAGRIAAVETGEGGTIEGLPVIGAEAHDRLEEIGQGGATWAMASEVQSRAVELAKKQFPLASLGLIEQFGQKAAEKFKAELDSKSAEKKAEHDKGVQGLIESIDSPDTSLADVVPEASESKAETP